MLTQSDKSELTIRIETTWNGQILATWIDSPDVQSQANSKEAALASLEIQIRARLATTEIISLRLDSSPKNNPWLDIAGKYADDPEFDRMLVHIEAERELTDRFAQGEAAPTEA